MPTYAYRCKNCSHEFDEFQSISADPLKICPSCNKESLGRVIGGGAGLIFKGSGFYLTDYKKNNSSPAGGNGKAAKPAEKTKTEESTTKRETPTKSETSKN